MYSLCEICMKQRGREIALDGKQMFLCFDCYHASRANEFYQAKHKPISIKQQIYNMTVKEFYLKPGFYKEPVNIEALQIASDILEGISYAKIDILKNLFLFRSLDASLLDTLKTGQI